MSRLSLLIISLFAWYYLPVFLVKYHSCYCLSVILFTFADNLPIFGDNPSIFDHFCCFFGCASQLGSGLSIYLCSAMVTTHVYQLGLNPNFSQYVGLLNPDLCWVKSLKSFKSSFFLVDFWPSWCFFCFSSSLTVGFKTNMVLISWSWDQLNNGAQCRNQRHQDHPVTAEMLRPCVGYRVRLCLRSLRGDLWDDSGILWDIYGI